MFNTSIGSLPHTSPLSIKKLKSLDIHNYFDLLNYFPYRYENYSIVSSIVKIQSGEVLTIRGEIIESKNQYIRRGLTIQKITIEDGTGKISLLWYNQPYLIRLLTKGGLAAVSGKVEKEYGRLIVKPSEYELIRSFDQPTIHTGRTVPIYSEKKGLSSRTIREKIFYLIRQINSKIDFEFLPEKIIEYNGLIDESLSYVNIHFPENQNLLKSARERLSFDELFLIQLSSNLIKKSWINEIRGNSFSYEDKNKKSVLKFIQSLPYQLTSAQNRVLKEIFIDLQKKTPMNRLLQGEVGSGKTVVAAITSYLTKLNGFKTLMMAPTEILAQQHYETIKNLFEDKLKIALVTSSQKISNFKNPASHSQLLNSDIIIGTQALITEKISFAKVGLVIVDEQHRFGVRQRTLLKNKGFNPHLLTMTATPIPRTVALTLYGELDFSIIDEMPKNRLKVKTFYVPKYKREAGYQWIIEKILKEQAQVFIICPLIEESDVETMKSVKAAKVEFEHLKKTVFSNFRLSLLHGKLKSKEKNQIMKDFKERKYDILVSTSVVEVGIDIPSATIILIEGAERYGLAQLHQLRGRVGRGDKQSYCFLYTEEEKVKNRLQFFAKNNDGLKLAEYDLKVRGPGDFFGTQQHGYLDLKIASLTDFNLINKTKNAVNYFIKYCQLKDYPQLSKKIEELRIIEVGKD